MLFRSRAIDLGTAPRSIALHQIQHTVGIQQHPNQRRRRMEGCLQNPDRVIRTTSYVLRTNQLPRHLPTNYEPNVQRNEDAIPERTIRLHGRHSHRHGRRSDATPNNRPPSIGQTRRRILLPPTRQMRIRKRKNRLSRSRHQPRTNPH